MNEHKPIETPPDVPAQYKPLVDDCVNRLVVAAEKLWPVIQELGDNFECGNEEIVITIKKK